MSSRSVGHATATARRSRPHVPRLGGTRDRPLAPSPACDRRSLYVGQVLRYSTMVGPLGGGHRNCEYRVSSSM